MAKSFQKLREEHLRICAPMGNARKQEIGVVEQQFPEVFGVGIGHLFGIVGHERNDALTRAAVWALMHPTHIHMPKHHVAQYLDLTEKEVEKYWLEAETIMIEGASNPAHEQMMTCFKFFGPTVARLLAAVV